MTVELRIALRYLFARKRQNAINIVSAVSAAGVCVVTAALIIVLSVMNGFSSLVEGMFSQFDPELKITAAHGKTFLLSEPFIQEVRAMPSVEVFCPCVQENALVQFADKQMAATLKGVTDDFRQLSRIDSIIIGGSFSVQEQLINPDGTVGRRFERCVVGSGLAEKLGVSAWNMSGLRFYAPKKGERINMVNPERSLNEEGAFMSGVFSVQQDKYDASFIVVSLDLARSLFDLKSDEVTAVELKLTEGDKTNLKTVKRRLQKMSGGDFLIQDRYEQQADFFRIVKVEKLLTILLLSFILLIAAFNIVGSLSMLMIDKQQDMRILRNLGASERQIRWVFIYEGWLISLLGAAIGLVIGITLCLLQQHYGLLKLGDGTNYIISAYPVALEVTDILLTALIVVALGFVAAYYPARQLKIKQ